jgi:dipeptide/tripeptide permease
MLAGAASLIPAGILLTQSYPLMLLGFALQILGASLTKVAASAELAALVPTRERNATLAVFLLAYVAVNFGAFTAPLVTGAIAEYASPALGMGLLIPVGLLASVAVVGLMLLSRPLEEEKQGFALRELISGGSALPLAASSILLLGVSAEVNFRPESSRVWLMINPVTVIIVSLAAAAVLLVLRERVAIAPQWPFGCGLMLMGVAGLLIGRQPDGAAPEEFLPSLLLSSAGESLVFALGLAMVARSTPTRLSPLPIVVWLTANQLLMVPQSVFEELKPSRLATGLGVSAMVCAVLAVLLGFVFRERERDRVAAKLPTPGVEIG